MRIITVLCVMLLTACGGAQTTQTKSDGFVINATRQDRVPKPVVFIGDSITAGWDLKDYLPDAINAGIPGQTSAQMLARFQADVLDKDPSVVIILAGTNDIRLLDDPNASNIQIMATMASAAGIRVILCEIPPIDNTLDFDFANTTQESKVVTNFNSEVILTGLDYGYPIVDYYDALILPDGTQNGALFLDGIHPNKAGYAVMWKVLSPLLDQNLSSSHLKQDAADPHAP